ncbi:MAG: hypothetical protein MI861_05305, partial [Pirellulales bacterium]|nr:hypothetical protein [Pirellulales bacterium]
NSPRRARRTRRMDWDELSHRVIGSDSSVPISVSLFPLDLWLRLRRAGCFVPLVVKSTAHPQVVTLGITRDERPICRQTKYRNSRPGVHFMARCGRLDNQIIYM